MTTPGFPALIVDSYQSINTPNPKTRVAISQSKLVIVSMVVSCFRFTWSVITGMIGQSNRNLHSTSSVLKIRVLELDEFGRRQFATRDGSF